MPHRDDGGGIVCVAQDITELKRVEQAVRLHVEELAHSNQELSALTQEMEDLLRVVSHDLRSPLINIQGFAKRLDPVVHQTIQQLEALSRQVQTNGLKAQLQDLKRAVEEKAPESLAFIAKGVARMDTLLSSLLLLSRVGRKTEPMQAHDLNTLLEELLPTFQHQLQETRITLIRHPLPRTVRCRKNELSQVFANLISNAIKFMGQGPERRIEIGGRELPDRIACDVTDTGIGIDPKDHARLFHPFSRLEELQVPGEGIGLAYVRKVLRSHGGDIRVESQKGRGSTFAFWLPRKHTGVT
jgi:signal transduction histidine kinase